MSQLYSIGYATKAFETFLEQLQQHNIRAIADVRSVPYSKVFHDYHREALASQLRSRGIHYVYLGEELGPRSTDATHYNSDGQVQFERLQKSKLFHSGIGRLMDGLAKDLNIAMLCAEKDPAVCHRSLLIGHYLFNQQGINTQHVCHNGHIEAESELQQRLILENGIAADMFTPQCECLELAWRAQSRRFAYRRKS